MNRIVVVGGGAGGLELATQLGDSYGKGTKARVTLVDRSRTHLWKPLLHEVAAGSMDMHAHQLDYLAQARWHHFTFVLGALAGLERQAKHILVAPVVDDEGVEILPARRIPYDTLVIAVGSESNDFGTPGVRDHAFTIDNTWQAHLFHRRLVNTCFRANFAADGRVIDIAIVGAGATGVELAAELHNTIRVLAAYGLQNFHYRDFGSLVSLGNYETVGTLMGFIGGGSLRVEGLVAKLFYLSLYRLHIWALHGFWRMALDTLARWIRTQTDPKVKLH